MEKLLSIKELANLLSVKTSTLYGWVHEGRVPVIRLGSRVVFSPSQIEEWIRQQSQPIPGRNVSNMGDSR